MSEQLWFDFTVEGVFVKGLGPRLTPELRRELRALGIDVSDLGPAYPVATVRKALDVTWKHVFPELSEAEAFRELGLLSVKGYLDTILGKAVLGMVRLLGVRRSLLRVHQMLTGGSNYVQASAELVAPTTIDITVNDTSGMPTYWEGLLMGGIQIAHAKNLRLSPLPRPEPGATWRVEWDE